MPGSLRRAPGAAGPSPAGVGAAGATAEGAGAEEDAAGGDGGTQGGEGGPETPHSLSGTEADSDSRGHGAGQSRAGQSGERSGHVASQRGVCGLEQVLISTYVKVYIITRKAWHDTALFSCCHTYFTEADAQATPPSWRLTQGRRLLYGD